MIVWILHKKQSSKTQSLLNVFEVLWIVKLKLTSIKMMKEENKAHYPEHTISFVKHSGGSVMVWVCNAASGSGTLAFDHFTADRSKRMNTEIEKHSPAGQQCCMAKVTHELF